MRHTHTQMIRGLLKHHCISSTGFQETLDHVSHNRTVSSFSSEVKGWLKLVLDKVLKAVSSSVETRHLAQFQLPWSRNVPKDWWERTHPLNHCGLRKTCQWVGTKSSFFKESETYELFRVTCSELIFIPCMTWVQQKCEKRAEGMQICD